MRKISYVFCLLKRNVKMLSENLKKIRTNQRYSRKQLGQLAGYSITTIQMIENGINDNPRIKTLISLAKILNVSVDQLIK